MANRLFVMAVVALWLASMSWLISDRILPSFFEGEPPLEETYEKGKAVAWQVKWEEEVVGTASSVRLPGVGGTTDLHNRIRMTSIPLMDLAPTWMRTAIGNFGDISFDANTRIEFDALGNFSAFNSRVVINDMPSLLNISGRVDDSNLNLNVRSGEVSYKTSVYIPESDSMNEILFPTSMLPDMYVGRTWREEVYNPFKNPGDPIDMFQAEVVSKEPIAFGGQLRDVYRVEFRSMNVSGIAHEARLQAECWVEPSGKVLRRDVHFGTAKLRFERLESDEAREASTELLDDLIRTGSEIEF